jgi:hypothetical protein
MDMEKHVKFVRWAYEKAYQFPPGLPRRMQRARGSAPIHPNRGHVEMRDLPERSGSGARDLPDALPRAGKPHALLLKPETALLLKPETASLSLIDIICPTTTTQAGNRIITQAVSPSVHAPCGRRTLPRALSDKAMSEAAFLRLSEAAFHDLSAVSEAAFLRR